jgi:hypothetical protein
MKDKLAIIVPYRDRQDHLDVFVPHMHEFLKDKGIDYTIFIAEQTDDRPFNYGKLCNVVTKEVGEEYTYFAFHDIDMLPINDECDYGYPESPTHLATNVEAHDYELPYPQYFGGVVLISREDFEEVNGYSNEYWGYGFEDLDLLYRIERAGLYLETYYDKNKTYTTYDELDTLPHRIENVQLSRHPLIHNLKVAEFSNKDYLYGSLNPLSKEITKKSFTISFWFNDRHPRTSQKNLFSFEGYDSGIFLNNGNQIIGQVWDVNKNHEQVVLNYSRNIWNHIIFEYDYREKTIRLTLNGKHQNIQSLKEDFEIFDYTNKHIKISDNQSEISISSILVFDSLLNDTIREELYFGEETSINDIITRFGLNPVIYIDYQKAYSRNLVLDKGAFLNHFLLNGTIKTKEEKIGLSDTIYIPFRLEGKYKSLVHEKDNNIIENYYEYNPDVLENSDIFFHEVIPNKLDYKSIGLSTIKYTLLDKIKRDGYELIRIVT